MAPNLQLVCPIEESSLLIRILIYILGACAIFAPSLGVAHQSFNASYSNPATDDSGLIEKKLQSSRPLPNGSQLRLEPGVANGQTCVIVGYRDEGTNSISDQAMKNVFQYYQSVTPPTNRPRAVRTIEELLSAIGDCPPGKSIVIATHGYGKYNGGFCLNESGTDCIGVGSSDFDLLAQALAGRRRVAFQSCLIGEGAAEGQIEGNFGNRLANQIHQNSDPSAGYTSQRLASDEPKVVVYSTKIYMATSGVRVQEDRTRELTFVPDPSNPPIQIAQNPPVTPQPQKPPQTPISQTPSINPQPNPPGNLRVLLRYRLLRTHR